jgi:gamma-glutamylcyclotransferase (GGCT)/AIG2-like uncharacterized protein YtfP
LDAGRDHSDLDCHSKKENLPMNKTLTAVFLAALFVLFPAVSHADDDVSTKLDEISKTQKQILDSLEQVKTQLDIIRVRVTSG